MDPHLARRLALAARLGVARFTAGLSERAAADALLVNGIECTREIIISWETAQAEPAASDLFVLAKVYRCRPGDFFEEVAWKDADAGTSRN